MSKKLHFYAILFWIGCTFIPCKGFKNTIVLSGTVFGTTYSIQLSNANDSKISFQKDIDSIFADLNQSLSTYLPTSDISKINKGDTALIVNHHFKTVFKKATQIWKASDGYFDPTVGNLVNAYGFGPKGEMEEIDVETRDSLLQLAGWDGVTLTEKNTLRKRNPNTFLDFNALAKGYAVDVVADYLQSLGTESYLIEIGGEIAAQGVSPKTKKAWKVGIKDPKQVASRTFTRTVSLKNRALATSGNYRKFRSDPKTGNRYVHIINPKTGKAERTSVLSVSVIAPNCMTADAWATALMLLPLDEGRSVVNTNSEIETYWIVTGEGEEVLEHFSKNWPQ